MNISRQILSTVIITIAFYFCSFPMQEQTIGLEPTLSLVNLEIANESNTAIVFDKTVISPKTFTVIYPGQSSILNDSNTQASDLLIAQEGSTRALKPEVSVTFSGLKARFKTIHIKVQLLAGSLYGTIREIVNQKEATFPELPGISFEDYKVRINIHNNLESNIEIKPVSERVQAHKQTYFSLLPRDIREMVSPYLEQASQEGIMEEIKQVRSALMATSFDKDWLKNQDAILGFNKQHPQLATMKIAELLNTEGSQKWLQKARRVWKATYDKNLGIVKDELESDRSQDRFSPEITEPSRNTPLLAMAVVHSTTPIIEKILEAKANVNKGDLIDFTPLMAATVNGRPDTVKLLLKYSADPRTKDLTGRTALDYVYAEGSEAYKKGTHKEIAKMLEEALEKLKP